MMDISVAVNRFPVHMAGFVVAQSGGNEAGLATVFNPNQPEQNGRFVVWSGTTSPGGPGAAVAHEIGHTLGLDDEEGVDGVQWPDSFMRGFMNTAGSAPILNWDLDSTIPGLTHGDVWQERVPSKTHPRASGFGFTGCDPNDPMACQTGHPDVSCNSVHVCVPGL